MSFRVNNAVNELLSALIVTRRGCGSSWEGGVLRMRRMEIVVEGWGEVLFVDCVNE